MCIVPPAPSSASAASPAAPPAPAAQPSCPAHLLGPQQRRQLALDALTDHSISQLARDHSASRKFVYQQVAKAQQALDLAFCPAPAPQEQVLFYLPVTRS